MEKFTTITSKVVPVRIKDVDTDMLYPASYMTTVERSGHGVRLFQRLKENDPAFSFNQARYDGAQILVSDLNFGCGSSREHAVWALTDWGIRVVIAKSFADIFSGNAGKNGLLLITLPECVVDTILNGAEEEEYTVTVDLESQRVTLPDGTKQHFDYDPFRKHCLLSGLDDIDYIFSKEEKIDAYREKNSATSFALVK